MSEIDYEKILRLGRGISFKKYNRLISIDEKFRTKEQQILIDGYEELQVEYYKKQLEYEKRLYKQKREFVVNYEPLLNKFIKTFQTEECKTFQIEALKNINVLLYYFSNDERFFECDNLSNKSKPSFEKGLLIVGGYGCGKSATMKTLKKVFNRTPLNFSYYTTNKIVSTFESFQDSESRGNYISKTKLKPAYFDDVKTEKEAMNYGKYNLMKDIIEQRYNNKVSTYITCNYKEDSNSLDDALYEFSEKYGPRVYDRLFEMFNIIEFKGKSFRI